jgi:hypothetical protein
MIRPLDDDLAALNHRHDVGVVLAVLPSNRHMTARLRLFLRFLEQRPERVVP